MTERTRDELDALIAEVVAQEERLQFTEFSHEHAWMLGARLREHARVGLNRHKAQQVNRQRHVIADNNPWRADPDARSSLQPPLEHLGRGLRPAIGTRADHGLVSKHSEPRGHPFGLEVHTAAVRRVGQLRPGQSIHGPTSFLSLFRRRPRGQR